MASNLSGDDRVELAALVERVEKLEIKAGLREEPKPEEPAPEPVDHEAENRRLRDELAAERAKQPAPRPAGPIGAAVMGDGAPL